MLNILMESALGEFKHVCRADVQQNAVRTDFN